MRWNEVINRVLSIALACLIIGVMFGSFSSIASAATTTYVPDDYSTIQAAVDAASPSDTIIVRDGTYTENIDVNTDNLTIQSENGANSTIIQAANPNYHVFEVTANYTEISGFAVKGAGTYQSGIHLEEANNCAISYNNLSSNSYGILLSHSSGNVISNNDASSNEYVGIFLFGSSNNAILNNEARSNFEGIALSDSSNDNVISSNTVSLNVDSGISLQRSNGNVISSNDASSNYDEGIFLGISNGNIVRSNNVSSNSFAGIAVAESSNNFVYLNNLNNSRNVYSRNSTNTWIAPDVITYAYNSSTYTNYLGNYWSDYTGSDADGDGIGDSLYIIDGDSDTYPLVEPFENYERVEDTTPPAKVIDLRILDLTSSGYVYPTGRAEPYSYAGWLGGGPGLPPYQESYYHLGQDMEANEGDDVYAITEGEIVYVSVSGWGEGNYGLLIKHKLDTGEEFLALYGHVIPNREDLRYATSGIVDPPVTVGTGEAFATIGAYDSIPHLHFGVHPGDEVPPSPWGRMPLDQWPETNGFVDPIAWIVTHSPFSPINPTSSVVLVWTASGDDGGQGTASQYDIRYSTSEITEATWSSTTQSTGEPTPQPAGSSENFTITGLISDTTYYFALKTADEVPNWSGLSNVVSRETTVSNQPPTANFTYSPYERTLYKERNPGVLEIVTFDASESYDIDGQIVDYKWDFGPSTDACSGIQVENYFLLANTL